MNSSCVNGHYTLCDEPLCGYPLYRKVLDPDKWLRVCPARVWIVSDTGSKDENESAGIRTYARSTTNTSTLPSDAVSWTDRNLNPRPGMQVVCFSKAEWVSQQTRISTDAAVAEGAALSDAAAVATQQAAPGLGCVHGIKEFKTFYDGFYCDVCGQQQTKGSTMFGCRKCDYDQCVKCHNGAM